MDRPIKIGIPLHVRPGQVADMAEMAESIGCESIWVSEHLIWPEVIPQTYPYRAGGQAPVTNDTPLSDPWVMLAAAATRTTTIRLGTWVYILPLRNPFVTARAVGTVDSLSNGRVLLGVGVGWMKDEFECADQAWANRGERSEEIVEILRSLWTGDVVDFDGLHYRFGPVRFAPPPPQQAALPIYWGGESRTAIDRAARIADGWIGVRAENPESAAGVVRELRSLRERAGKDPDAFEITLGVSELDPPTLEQYAATGVDRLILRSFRPGKNLEEVRTNFDGLATVIEAISSIDMNRQAMLSDSDVSNPLVPQPRGNI